AHLAPCDATADANIVVYGGDGRSNRLGVRAYSKSIYSDRRYWTDIHHHGRRTRRLISIHGHSPTGSCEDCRCAPSRGEFLFKRWVGRTERDQQCGPFYSTTEAPQDARLC